MRYLRAVSAFSTLLTCADLTAEEAEEAASGSTELRALLKRVAEIARPGSGCPKVLMVLARLVGKEWVEGDLRIELHGDDSATTLDVLCEHGAGIRERLAPMAHLPVPFDEFARALALAPKMALPLTATEEGGKLVLVPRLGELDHGDGEERTTAPPPDGHEEIAARASLRTPVVAWPEDPTAGPHVRPTPHADASSLAELADELPLVEAPPTPPTVHTRPTVRRMVAVDVPIPRSQDPRSEDD